MAPGFPGPPTPGQGEALYDHQTIEATGVDITSTGTTTVGTIVGSEIEIVEVRVDSDDAGIDFNVELEGNDIFSSEQSPGGTSEEGFTPDSTDDTIKGVDSGTVDVDISTSVASGTADVFVHVKHKA